MSHLHVIRKIEDKTNFSLGHVNAHYSKDILLANKIIMYISQDLTK